MKTIQEMIDSGEVVLGKTKLNLWKGDWFIPYFYKNDWVCDQEDKFILRVDSASKFVLYEEPKKLVPHWKWIDPGSNIETCDYHTEPHDSYTIKAAYSETLLEEK